MLKEANEVPFALHQTHPEIKYQITRIPGMKCTENAVFFVGFRGAHTPFLGDMPFLGSNRTEYASTS